MAQAMSAEPGIDLVIAEDGAEALATVSAGWTPELLLLDAHLPDTSGHALLMRLRALPGLAQVTAWPTITNARLPPASITAGPSRCRRRWCWPACRR